MTFADKVLSGIVVGLFVWLTTKTAIYLLTRERIKAGLLTDIELHITSIKESDAYLTHLITTLTAGQTIKKGGRYSADGYIYFRSILTELPRLFSKRTFTNILRYYKSIEEYDFLVGGFFDDITAWKITQRILSADDVTYLSKKIDRITALGRILTKINVEHLDDLPIDYEGRLPAKTMI